MQGVIQVPVVDQNGIPYEISGVEEESIKGHVCRNEAIESSWVRRIVVNVQEDSMKHPLVVAYGYYMNNKNDPFTLTFRMGADPIVAEFIRTSQKEEDLLLAVP